MIKTTYVLALLITLTCNDLSCGQEQQAMAMVPVLPTVDAMWGYKAPASYQILRRPTSHDAIASLHTHGRSKTTVETKPVHPYAYGWFGTQYSPQWSRQFGYQKAYTQWTLK